MKLYIRTTGERVLHKSINKELGNNYTLLIDKEHKPIDSFIAQLKLIDNEDSLLLEDDVILCRNFLQEVNKAIDNWKGHIINFFTFPFKYVTTVLCEHPFVFNQCTFYPKGISKQIAEEMEKLRLPYSQYDVLESRALEKLKIPYVIYRPCLVQHIDNSTLIQKQSGYRRCIWFKDYLDDLGIDYLNAYTLENKKKLTNYMNENFKKEV